ncbi:EEIG1/EHBP1 N-terminal domain containing protein [Quillaja saponaria]|uniref:EEIG1/EHBP1 N-terminal domain containing protein n=1 Tax=Quillaja saponaria TaxID=32244 RepID=A0AAD7M8P8_QUISA|nr:EEIG1/EHBP1 N-terminal domain containing protein [Quillaja saponaria]
MWHSGSLFVSFGKEVKEKVDVSFRIFGTEDEAIDLFQRTKIRHQSFLQSLFIDFDDKSKKWVICFQQNVTCTLTEWIDSKSLVAYENKKCLMNQELSKIINDILKAVQYLHEEGLRHGNLKSPMSYAIVHKSVLLLDIQYQNDGCDLSELMLYLKTFMDKGERRTEWLTFSKMVGIPDLTVEDLLRHPMLLDSESRLNNLHNQAKRISDRCAGVYPLNFLYALDNIEGYERWKEKVIGHPVFGRLINHTWFARTETASLLFRFVYNSVQHYNTEVRHHNAVASGCSSLYMSQDIELILLFGSDSTNLVVPLLGSVGEGKIEFNESFRLPVTLLRDMSVKGGDGDAFKKNCLQLNLYEPRKHKTVKGQLLGQPS